MTNLTRYSIAGPCDTGVLIAVNGTDKSFMCVAVTCFREILKFSFMEATGKPP